MFGWGGAVGEFSISLLVLVYDEGWGPDYSKCGWGERSHFTNYVSISPLFINVYYDIVMILSVIPLIDTWVYLEREWSFSL